MGRQLLAEVHFPSMLPLLEEKQWGGGDEVGEIKSEKEERKK